MRRPPNRPAGRWTKNCSDFDDQGAAQRYFDYYYPFYDDVAGLDGDGNKVACESLGTTTTTSSTTTTTSSTTSSTTSTTTTMGGGPDGADLFANTPGSPGTCAGCHGAMGNGGIGPDINGTGLSVADVTNAINTGPGIMPNNFPSRLTPAEIQAIAEYVAGGF